MVAAQAVLSAVAENAAGCDAVIVAAFGDPGLGGARELLSIPVVGIAEAAMLTACMLGDRISIVSVSRRHVPVLRECILRYGLGERLASIRTTAEPVDPSYVGDAQNTYRDQLVRLCHDTVEQDGAEVVIFGGGPLAGLARTVADRIPVPVLDGTACAVRQAETLVALRPSKPSKGSYSRPAPKTVTGVAPDLARLFGAG
jgi:allantoin racemase